MLDYFSEQNSSYFHKIRHEGYLRHLLVRKAQKTGEMLIALVTSTQETHDLTPFVALLQKLPLDGKITGVLHIKNDSLADVVQSEETVMGRIIFMRNCWGFASRFHHSPFSRQIR